MRITGKQLRRIIQEEVARMVNEEDAGTRLANQAFDDPKLAALAAMLQRQRLSAVVNAPRIDRAKYGGLLSRVLDKLMSGQVFSDRNPDADAAIVVDLFAQGLAKANPSNTALAAAVGERLPASGFSSLLLKLQRMLGIKADGVLGIQSYFALLTGGAVNFQDPNEAIAMGRKQAAALLKSLGITADMGKLKPGESPTAEELIQLIKDAETQTTPSSIFSPRLADQPSFSGKITGGTMTSQTPPAGRDVEVRRQKVPNRDYPR